MPCLLTLTCKQQPPTSSCQSTQLPPLPEGTCDTSPQNGMPKAPLVVSYRRTKFVYYLGAALATPLYIGITYAAYGRLMSMYHVGAYPGRGGLATCHNIDMLTHPLAISYQRPQLLHLAGNTPDTPPSFGTLVHLLVEFNRHAQFPHLSGDTRAISFPISTPTNPPTVSYRHPQLRHHPGGAHATQHNIGTPKAPIVRLLLAHHVDASPVMSPCRASVHRRAHEPRKRLKLAYQVSLSPEAVPNHTPPHYHAHIPRPSHAGAPNWCIFVEAPLISARPCRLRTTSTGGPC